MKTTIITPRQSLCFNPQLYSTLPVPVHKANNQTAQSLEHFLHYVGSAIVPNV